MSVPWDAPDASARDTAMLADALHALRRQLAEEDPHEPTPTPEVQQLVQAAIAELHRVTPPVLQGGIAPVLGAGVLQELLRRAREPENTPDPVHLVDARR